MKKFLKKVAAIAAITTLSVSAGMTPVYADELQENLDNDVVETNYDIAPGLDLDDEDVDRIIEKTKILCAEQGLSEDETEQLVNVWYDNSDNEISTYAASNANSFPAKQFFTAVTAQAGQKIEDELYIRLEYGRLPEDSAIVVNDYTLYNESINTSTSEHFYGPTDYYYYVYQINLTNLGKQTTQSGNIVKFDISVNNNLTGINAYQKIANNSFLRMSPDDSFEYSLKYDYKLYPCKLPINYEVETSAHRINYNIGAYGDVAVDSSDCGIITSYDAQYVLAYISEDRTLNPIQRLAADTDRDGSITSHDALQILNYSTGKINKF